MASLSSVLSNVVGIAAEMKAAQQSAKDIKAFVIRMLSAMSSAVAGSTAMLSVAQIARDSAVFDTKGMVAAASKNAYRLNDAILLSTDGKGIVYTGDHACADMLFYIDSFAPCPLFDVLVDGVKRGDVELGRNKTATVRVMRGQVITLRPQDGASSNIKNAILTVMPTEYKVHVTCTLERV